MKSKTRLKLSDLTWIGSTGCLVCFSPAPDHEDDAWTGNIRFDHDVARGERILLPRPASITTM